MKCASALCVLLLCGLPLLAETIAFVEVPAVLPRDTPASASYSPLLRIQYAGLDAETYTVRVHLLETDPPDPPGCASSLPAMWCNGTISIDNESGNNAAGTIADARLTDVHNYGGFLWVADLYDESGALVASAQQSATATTNRAPVLGAIGNQNAVAGQSLDFTVTATDAENDPITLSAANLPAGATFNAATGAFHWVPDAVGTHSSIRFAAAQSTPAALADAELIAIVVSEAPPPAGALAFTSATHTAGEAGPSVLTITRTNGTYGTVTVSYATSNGTATAGSDYATTSGVLTFANGETSRTIRVPGINSSAVEPDETFQVQLSAPTGGATLGTPSAVTVTITDDDDPQVAGQWSGSMEWPVVPIHMHLLPSGKVMFWDRHNDNPMWDGTPHLWDPAVPSVFTTLPVPGWDLFCSGHSFMADGRLLVAGGHVEDHKGEPKAGIYDPAANSWTPLPDMNGGRWYPTNTTLPNGDVLVVAGTRNGYGDINPVPQVWQTATGTWRDLTTATMGGIFAWPDYYPFLYVASNGQVFNAGPQKTARFLDTSGTGDWTDVANSTLDYRDYGSSVMYGDGKVLIAGGNARDTVSLPSATAEVIDLNAAQPAWRSVASMTIGRKHLNTTLLPDGTVLVTGGSSSEGADNATGKVLYGELWNPSTETWTPMAAHARIAATTPMPCSCPTGASSSPAADIPIPSRPTAPSRMRRSTRRRICSKARGRSSPQHRPL